MVGRFGFGFCTGIQSMILGKALSETIPSSEQQRYMIWINVGSCLGMLMAQIFNMFLPIYDDSDPNNKEQLNSDQYWKLVWAFPIILKIAALIVIPLYIKYFSLTNLIMEFDPEKQISDDLKNELNKIYLLKDEKDLNTLACALKE